jgi:hypothetical protein
MKSSRLSYDLQVSSQGTRWLDTGLRRYGREGARSQESPIDQVVCLLGI